MSTGYVDGCKFLASSTGTADFVPFAAVTGYQTPASANAVNGTRYYYRAESTDLTQWEIGYGNYTVSGTTLARTTILFSSNSNSKVSFTAAPQVAIVAVAETMVPQSIGQLPGTTTNDNASAGNIGEFIFSEIASGSAVALTSSTATDITSISLTAGDWDVYGGVDFAPAGGSLSATFIGWVSAISHTLPAPPNDGAINNISVSSVSGGAWIPTGQRRLSLSTTTTIYLSGYCSFSGGTMGAYGGIYARRAR